MHVWLRLSRPCTCPIRAQCTSCLAYQIPPSNSVTRRAWGLSHRFGLLVSLLGLSHHDRALLSASRTGSARGLSGRWNVTCVDRQSHEPRAASSVVQIEGLKMASGLIISRSSLCLPLQRTFECICQRPTSLSRVVQPKRPTHPVGRMQRALPARCCQFCPAVPDRCASSVHATGAARTRAAPCACVRGPDLANGTQTPIRLGASVPVRVP